MMASSVKNGIPCSRKGNRQRRRPREKCLLGPVNQIPLSLVNLPFLASACHSKVNPLADCFIPATSLVRFFLIQKRFVNTAFFRVGGRVGAVFVSAFKTFTLKNCLLSTISNRKGFQVVGSQLWAVGSFESSFICENMYRGGFREFCKVLPSNQIYKHLSYNILINFNYSIVGKLRPNKYTQFS